MKVGQVMCQSCWGQHCSNPLSMPYEDESSQEFEDEQLHPEASALTVEHGRVASGLSVRCRGGKKTGKNRHQRKKGRRQERTERY